MSRNYQLFLNDIRQACHKINTYIEPLASIDELTGQPQLYEAVLFNLLIIGEAVKNLPDEIRQTAPQIEWRKIAGLRDVIIQGYFGVKAEIIWDAVNHKIPELEKVVQNLIDQDDTE